jgi:hypothetical protein
MFQMAGVNAFSWPISSVPADQIVPSILILRGDRVMLDSELANLYGVATNVLLQAVKRNSERFHEGFMLRLTVQEWEFLRSQSVTLNTGSGRHRKYLPHAFTEQGVFHAVLSATKHTSDRGQCSDHARLRSDARVALL